MSCIVPELKMCLMPLFYMTIKECGLYVKDSSCCCNWSPFLSIFFKSLNYSCDTMLEFVSQVNFVGKLLGPQGSTIKRLQEETGAKISVLGKGSMRDKSKVCMIFFFYFIPHTFMHTEDVLYS